MSDDAIEALGIAVIVLIAALAVVVLVATAG